MDQEELFQDFELVYHAKKDLEWKIDRIRFYLNIHKEKNNQELCSYDLAIDYFRDRDTILTSMILKELNKEHAESLAKNHVDDDKHAYRVASFMYELMQGQEDVYRKGIHFQTFYLDVWRGAFGEKNFKRINNFILGLQKIEENKRKGIFIA